MKRVINFVIRIEIRIRMFWCHLFGHNWHYQVPWEGNPTWRWCRRCGEFETGEFEKE